MFTTRAFSALEQPSAGVGDGVPLHIRELVRQSGLRREQLYMWERRYGFPQPLRDHHGDRVYPVDQIEKLLIIQQLLKNGWRAGAVVALPLDELRARWVADRPQSDAPLAPDVALSVQLIGEHRIDELRELLAQALVKRGLRDFVLDILMPLNDAVGDGCVRGELRAFQQFRYAELAKRILRGASQNLRPAQSACRVLIATPPHDVNSLGLAMLEALLLCEGAQCVALGVGVPLQEIAAAAVAYKTRAVGLVFEHSHAAKVAAQQVRTLRAALPTAIELWATGRAAGLVPRPIEGTLLVADTRQLVEVLREKGALR
jgi:DNA-binding transcriptional MerR regulator/methylmalonyl-CoA mutase cobalamin-binding subunit